MKLIQVKSTCYVDPNTQTEVNGVYVGTRPVLINPPNRNEQQIHDSGQHLSYGQPYCVICGLAEDNRNWLRLELEDGWQTVRPVTDIRPHADLDCPCGSKVDYLNKIVVHNSFEDKKRIDEAMGQL
jgi:hypothetical protein